MRCCTIISRNVKKHTGGRGYFYVVKCIDTLGKKFYKKFDSISLNQDDVLNEANLRFCGI